MTFWFGVALILFGVTAGAAIVKKKRHGSGYGPRTKSCIGLTLLLILIGVADVAYGLYCLAHPSCFLAIARINAFHAVLMTVLVAAICFVAGLFRTKKPPVSVGGRWAIGIYASSAATPIGFVPRDVNPVLSAADVTDVDADFVADPFLVRKDGRYFVFFELKSRTHGRGVIGLASSDDGYRWKYGQVVLVEPFHLSYPCVFEWNDCFYMIPECGKTQSVRLYKATDFPTQWRFEKAILTGGWFADSTIFEYHERWWLFTNTRANDILRLYHAETPLGPWTEHARSPIIRGNDHFARPAGRVIVQDNRVFRYAQDDDPDYGVQTWAFEITELTTESYQEHLVGDCPVLRGTEPWNWRGMHHISSCRAGDIWLAAVDGR